MSVYFEFQDFNFFLFLATLNGELAFCLVDCFTPYCNILQIYPKIKFCGPKIIILKLGSGWCLLTKLIKIMPTFWPENLA